MDSHDTLTQWALDAAARGWPIFPLQPHTKRPALHGQVSCPGTGACHDGHHGWEQRATTEAERIRATWAHTPANIGLATGPAGLVVLDLDTAGHAEPGQDGAEQLAALATERGVSLPATYTVTTPSGGWHLYYTAPAGVSLRNTAGHVASRIDSRAHGGYVVAAGSVLDRGGYELHDDSDPVELPAWLVQALTERPAAAISARREIGTQHHSAYAASALDGECQRVRSAPPHRHNTVLASAAFNLGQLTPAGLLDEPTARAELQHAAEAMATGDCDCTPREIARVIDAGLTAGARKPRSITGRQEAA